MLEECECETKPDVGDWWDIKMYLWRATPPVSTQPLQLLTSTSLSNTGTAKMLATCWIVKFLLLWQDFIYLISLI